MVMNNQNHSQPRFLLQCLWAGIFSAAACIHAHADEHVLVNHDFENGSEGWSAMGPVTITTQSDDVQNGCCAVMISNRTATWNGIGQSVTDTLVPGQSYAVSVWARLAEAGEDEFKLTLRTTNESGTQWSPLTMGRITSDKWQQLVGAFTYEPGSLDESLFIYAEGPQPDVAFLMDNAEITPLDADWTDDAAARIDALRKRDMEIILQDQNGCPLPDVTLQITQTRSRFAFGTAVSHWHMGNPNYTSFLADNFEWAVMENASKWRQNQPNEGPPTYADADLIADFCRENNLRMRGHCITWANPDRVPNWGQPLSGKELMTAIEDRFESVVQRYADDFEHWDINNEMLSHAFFADRLGSDIRSWMFERTRELDPDVLCMVNDYSVITSNRQTLLVQQVEALEQDGAEVDAIGVQGHFGSVPRGEVVLKRLDNVAASGKPIWITEYDTNTSDAEDRADALETVYRAAFSHPAVDGILMWGFWAGAHHQGADGAIIDLDWTLNAAGERYLSLREEWRTEALEETDADGALTVRGFHGTYIVHGVIDGVRHSHLVELEPGKKPFRVTLTAETSNPCFNCSADLDDNGHVDSADLGLLLAAWGSCPSDEEACPADLDLDGVVNAADLGLLLSLWGECN